MDFSSLLEQMWKTSIRIEYDSNTDAECQIGASKIGGMPDLPPGFEWFYFRGKPYGDMGTYENRPLSFLAQINCEEASKYDKDSILPVKGMLYFFYELETMTWGFDPKDKGSARVYYYPCDVGTLSRTDFPLELPAEYRIPEASITFSSRNELPDFDEFREWHEGFDGEHWYKYSLEYYKTKDKMIPESDEDSITKLLGYADSIQGSMLLSCEETTNGVFTGDFTELPEDVLRQYKKNCTKWQLLFQLDSIRTEEYELLWGDIGRLYFYINMDDLKALNFDNCWLILQCS